MALKSPKPIVLLATGIQYGKTVVGAVKLRMAIHKSKTLTDAFLVTSPTYKILTQSTLPPILKYLEGFGEFSKQDMVFRLFDGRVVYFRTATDPDSIVGITNIVFVYGDEAGLYGLYFWENMQARAAFKNAQILLTTSPYTMNWVYRDLIKPKQKDPKLRPDVEYLRARSIDNPFFPKEYYERMKQSMDERRFNAMFGGSWDRMEGLVYDCFDEDLNTINPFALPQGTKFYGGIDWGHTQPFALVLWGIAPNGDHYQITERYKTGLTVLDMIGLAKQIMQFYKVEMFYCDPSQPAYIAEFNRAGVPSSPANNDIQLGIGLFYELIKTRRYKIFRGDNRHTIDELSSYHYPSPEEETSVDKDIKDRTPVKQNDHLLDAARYLTVAVYQGFHRKAPEIISHLDEQKKLDIYERAKRIYEPSNNKRFESW